jgi:MFS transporter, ACS family, tartrate transporter
MAAPVFTKCAWRLVPFLALLYAINLLDRNNVAFAALTMNEDLGFSKTVFGIGAGVFFVGFLLFQVPSSLLLERVGVRRWISVTLLAWGAISAGCAAVESSSAFYVLRFFLGMAEAGFFPGMSLYLGYWFPNQYRARLTAGLMLAVPLTKVFGGPLSGVILQMDDLGGIAGWRWLFLIEGMPAILLGLIVFGFLPDGPKSAAWLSPAEKETITTRLAAEDTAEHREFLPILRDMRVYALALVLFGILLGNDSLSLFLPLIIQEMGFSTFQTGFVVAAPNLLGAGAMLFWGRSSDMRGERVWHVALAALLSGAGFAVAAAGPSGGIILFGLTCAVMGIAGFFGPFYSLPPSFLTGPAAAGGVALIYALGSIAGFAGPVLIGFLRDETGGYAASMAMFAVASVLSAFVILLMRKRFSTLDVPMIVARGAG